MAMRASPKITRRGLLGIFAGAATLAAAPVYGNTAGLLRGAGDLRRLRMYSVATGESLDTIYWVDGTYIPEAMAEINHLMRDWRTGTEIDVDWRTVDIIAATHRMLEAEEPYLLLSGYRSPQTNAMLRKNSPGVSKNSLHIKGQAADLRHEGRSVAQIAKAAISCAAGGVGAYRRSNFVHMDCGDLRRWNG